MKLNITKITVILQDGSRHFTAYTDLPPRISCDTDDVLTLNIFIPGDWEVYLNTYFPGVEIEIIDARTWSKK